MGGAPFFLEIAIEIATQKKKATFKPPRQTQRHMSTKTTLFPEYAVRSITFTVSDPAEIANMSVVAVDEANLYSKGLPTPGAANDLKMGSCDRRLRCSTCRHGVSTCMGHPGSMSLATPVTHWLYIDTVVKVLRCTCYFCSKLLVDHSKRENTRRFANKTLSKRLSAISVHCRKRACYSCGGPQPEWVRKGLRISGQWPADTKFESEEEAEYLRGTPIDTLRARHILRYLSEEDCEFLGLGSRPEHMILTTLLVPPPLIRPTTSINDGSRCKGHDDLTTLLRDIVKENNKIKKSIEEGKDPDQDDIERLTINLATYMDKDGGATTTQTSLGGTGAARTARKHITRSGPVMSLGRRLAGKRGRFRGTITGKRVDYTSRSVIVPEPHLDIWQLAIPLHVARIQTLPETVTNFNRDMLRECVLRGDHLQGRGAHSVTRPDGTVIHLGMAKNLRVVADALGPGWKVRRHLQNGDWALFNRQPTLHKMGMMGHQVVVHDKKTFGLPVPCTPPYNADFDGDEMVRMLGPRLIVLLFALVRCTAAGAEPLTFFSLFSFFFFHSRRTCTCSSHCRQGPSSSTSCRSPRSSSVRAPPNPACP
ncbi:MAG: hypothetical protein CL450_07300 [Acidimicrobiaceae bacterium]|nr:hypothetical protein [Acidimicrobiaceae bacterium]